MIEKQSYKSQHFNPMTKPMFSLLFFCAVLFVSTSFACGPWLPESYVSRNDEVFYAPPRVGFSAEIEHLLPDSVPHAAVFEDDEIVIKSAVQELLEALKPLSLADTERDRLLEDYQKFRSQLTAVKQFQDRQPFKYYEPPVDVPALDAALNLLNELEVPDGLPKEFEFYLKGALAFYRYDISTARSSWQAVLDLPKESRHFRSVMAAFMIARTGDEQASETYQLVRQLVNEGYADAQGLAAASYGREARYYLYSADCHLTPSVRYQRAIDLYFKQWQSGYSNAIHSLKITAREAWEDRDSSVVEDLAAVAQSRAVLLAYVLTNYDAELADKRRRMLSALPDAKSITMKEAGRFALLEYQHNELTTAKLWLSYADPQDALALWVRSKLLLREGKIDEGRTLMLALTDEIGTKGNDWQRLDTKRAWAELGLLMLREERYVQAAEYFEKSESWEDLAYVLERLLDTDSLMAFARAHTVKKPTIDFYDGSGVAALTARRLMREAQFESAMEFFDTEIRSNAEDYVTTMREASDATNDPGNRAQQYWKAAKLMRDQGINLFGTELEPDFAWFDGSFEWGSTSGARLHNNYAPYAYSPRRKLNTVSDDERERLNKTAVVPNKRFHYRYRAAQLAEWSAGLLPNDSEDAALIYTIAGNWLKLRDPQAADRLYKLLVVRCPNTTLGQVASASHWLPSLPDESVEPFESDSEPDC